MKTSVHQTEYVTIVLDEETPALSEEWIGMVSSEEFRQTLLTKFEKFKELRIRYPNLQWIADMRDLKGPSSDIMSWMSEKFYQKLTESGIRKVAYVVPDHLYWHLSDEQIGGTKDQRSEILHCFFDGYDAAARWLTSQVYPPSA